MSKLEQSTNNIPKTSLSLKGSFGDEKIDYSLYPTIGSKKVVFNIHGTFGNKNGTNGKYENFAEELQSTGISSILFASSRKSEIDESISDSYERKKASFQGKTFKDELADAREALNHTIENSEELLGVASQELEITLNGNSLGGILAFYLAKEFPQVKAISSVGTGLRLEKSDVPILSTLPNPDELRQVISEFSGRYTMHEALSDGTFSAETYNELYNTLNTPNKNRVKYTGVNHSFRKIGATESKNPYKKVSERVMVLVNNEELINRTIDLESEVGQAKEIVPQELHRIFTPHTLETKRIILDRL